MLKIACIFSFKASSWVSCQKIVLNLHKSYEACAGVELNNFNFSSTLENFGEIAKLAEEIVNSNPDVISILDHKPHPGILLQQLSRLYAHSKNKPKIIIHIFGDFSLYFREWEKAQSSLLGFEVEFLVASDRQKIYLDKFLAKNKSVVCPFPVDSSEFSPNQKLRDEQRAQWNLQDEDVVFIFTGRLSRQKRIKTLISTFSKEFQYDSHAHLFLYGDPDNIGDPFVGIKDIESEYFRCYYSFYKTLAPSVQKRIHFMGSVPNSELPKVYQGADIMVNLSVHNDEDFGMSVAEAQSVGLPSAITDWGGLASFEHPEIPNAVQFIPVKIGKRHKLVAKKYAKQILRNYFENPHRELRQAIANAAQEKFGLNSTRLVIESKLHSKSDVFQGFTPLITQLATPYLDQLNEINSLYREIYSAYVRTN